MTGLTDMARGCLKRYGQGYLPIARLNTNRITEVKKKLSTQTDIPFNPSTSKKAWQERSETLPTNMTLMLEPD